MKDFVQLYRNLDQTTSTNAKVAALIGYFQEASPEDKLWCIALLLDKRPPRPLPTTRLKELASEVSGLPYWLVDESHHIVGDLSETIALITDQSFGLPEKSLSALMTEISHLKSKPQEEKEAYVLNHWNGLNREERYLFNKLIGGGFRMGVSSQLVIRALAQSVQRSTEEVAHKLMGDWSPLNTTLETLFSDHAQAHLIRPYPFYLAYPLEEEPENLGNVEDWIVERKWDGIRGQIVVRNGILSIWSRGEELVTDKFPEFHFLENSNLDFVIDGEIVCFNGKDVLPFALLQTRIGRKKVSTSILQSAPVGFIAYDLLESEGKDLRAFPLSERRKLLEDFIKNLGFERIVFSEEVKANDWSELKEIRSRSRSMSCEGLMLKRRNSEYKVGRKRGDWWKWKMDAMTIDAVMIYAMRGHGRRSNLYTDFTFAVWEGEQLIPFTKAYSGLTDEEMKQVDDFVKRNTLDKFGPVRSVKPELVFEIAFEGIQRSSRHKSGIALRFPRIHRWRQDKPAKEANTKEDLYNLLDYIQHENSGSNGQMD